MTKYYIMRKREVHHFMRDLGKLECSEIKIHGCSVVKIRLSEDALRVISLKAAKVFEAVKRKWSSIEKLETGLRGQVASSYQLGGDWREGVNQMREGVPDEYDIKFKGFKIDVKTFEWNGHSSDPDTWLVINWWKFRDPLRCFPYYIGCMVRDSADEVMILGFTSHDELERVGVKVNYSEDGDPDKALIGLKSISSFTPIKDLPEALEKERSRRAQTTLKRSTRRTSGSGQVI